LESHPNYDGCTHSGNGFSRVALDTQEECFFKRAAVVGFDCLSWSLAAYGIPASKVHTAF
jgi:hypothetical protein